MYCRSCRKWFPNNILFCDICGKPLVKDLDIYGENFFNGDVQAFDTMILAREVLVHGLMRWCETEFTIMEES